MFSCLSDRWAPGLGEPDPAGWLAILLYAMAAMLAFDRARKTKDQAGLRSVFWFSLAVLMALMGIAKLFDLQAALTMEARCISFAEGWYDGRRTLQKGLILVVTCAGLALSVGVIVFLRGKMRRLLPLLVGLVLLIAYVIARAASIHELDSLLYQRRLRISLSNLIEIGALVLIIFGMVRQLPRRLRLGPKPLKETAKADPDKT